jgi:head-tail adaptor
MFLKKGDDRLQPGQFDTPIFVYDVTSTSDGAGGEIRTPRVEDLGSAAPTYSAIANVQWFQGQLELDAGKTIGVQMALISIMYSPSRQPVQGTLVKIKSTGQCLEVTFVDSVNMARKKVELTCRLIQ